MGGYTPKQMFAHTVPRLIRYGYSISTGNFLTPYFQELMGVQAECSPGEASKTPFPNQLPPPKKMVLKPYTITSAF